MVRRITVLLCLLAVGAFAVGCGSSDSSSSTTPSTPAATPAADTTASDAGSGSGAAAATPEVQAAVAQCKQSIDSNPAVKDDIKPDLEKICDKAASGDVKSAQEATKEVCLKIVDSSVPSGPARDQAESACKAAGG